MSESARLRPAVVLAGTGSGSGKTTLTCALLAALRQRGLTVQPFKCGPDYIDPQHHSRITGRYSRNLDSYLLSKSTLQHLFCRAADSADLSLVEGVMGYYDGLGGTSLQASTWETAQWLRAKTVLIVDCAGMSLSVAAIIRGFQQFVVDSRIAAVILNHCSAGLYQLLRQPIEDQSGLPLLGYLPPLPDGSFASRHLGLVTAAEIADFDQRVARLAETAQQTIDLGRLVQVAKQAEPLVCPPPPLPPLPRPESCRIAMAKDEAFCFHYRDNWELLQQLGAELCEFSPLRDQALPADCDGLYLGGGYPELHAAALQRNRSLRQQIRAAVQAGLPTWAECGGFLYLQQEYLADAASYRMVGALPGSYQMTQRLGRFGYQELIPQSDNLLAPAGTLIRAHEFHYSQSTENGDACLARKPSRPEASWPSVQAGPTIWAGYPHLHLWSDPQLAVNFVQACRRWRAMRRD